MRSVAETLKIGAALDRRYAELRGEMATSKDRSLIELARVLASHRVRYAVIGGVAVQIWSEEPRTTIDIDIAVASYEDLPRAAMERAGFVLGKRFEHSENWTGPDGTPVHFSDDPWFAAAVSEAAEHRVADTVLRVASVTELVRAKLRAARDAARRRSKRLLDLADAASLVEQHPSVRDSLTDGERKQLDEDPSRPRD